MNLNKLILYHGSEQIIEKPIYGTGNPHNDYGLGFYCTEYPDLAKEWACNESHGGFANKYELSMKGLRLLDLNGENYCILHWLSVLLTNRKFTLDNSLAVQAKTYILENFTVDTSGYDIIRGYRADDSYFSFAKDFLQNSISIKRLSQVMKLGNLGNQIVLISPQAFKNIRYLGCEEAPKDIHFPLRKKRDELARLSYLSNKQGDDFSSDDIYMLDILRNEMNANDPRLQ